MMTCTFKNKNDYTVTAYQGSKKVNTMKFVHDVKKYAQWLDQKKISWAVLNVYNRRSREFITRFYKGEIITSKPK
jgi:hypothetical protein